MKPVAVFRNAGRLQMRLFALSAIVALLFGAWSPVPVRAGGLWYVAPAGGDGNDCLAPASACRTIGAAVGKATAGDTINIAAGTYTEHLTLDKDLALVGAGADSTTIDGGGGAGVFTIFIASVQIANLTIRNGRSVGSGGGITNWGSLALIDSSVSENATTLGEGFQGFGGGIANFGTLALTNTAVLSNTGVFGGGIYNRGRLSAVNSTISGNTAAVDGGGIDNVLLGKANLLFTTVADNSADGDHSGDGDGGGLFNAATSTFNLDSTLLGGNADTGGQGPDCGGTFNSTGHNVVQNLTGCTLGGPDTHAEIVGQAPLIGPLAANGGPTLTHALLAGSPAIDHSDNPTCPATDQRGVARPQGGACDTGAYEAAPPPSEVGVLYVAPTGSDANDCLAPATACQTIGAALGKANPGNTIRAAAGTYAERLTITADISIIGAGTGQTIVDGTAGGSVILIAGGHVRIAHLSIQNGQSIGAGGGIANFGTLTLATSNVSGNRALLGEGFQGLGGGIANFGTLVLSATSVLSNSAFVGGAIYNSGTLTATASTLSQNTAAFGRGFQTGVGGAIANFGRMALIDSGVISNTAVSDDSHPGQFGRGLPGLGGGIANFGTLVLSATSVLSNSASFGAGLVNFGVADGANSTLSGNSARHAGGGIANAASGDLHLAFVTIADNTAGSAGAIDAGGGISNEISGTVALRGTLLAGNSAGLGPDCSGTLVSEGHNLIQSESGCTRTGDLASDMVDADPLIGLLAANGGPTLTHALLSGSPAIDAAAGTACPATDQRGVARPQGGACDIGSYEYRPVGLLAGPVRVFIPLLRHA